MVKEANLPEPNAFARVGTSFKFSSQYEQKTEVGIEVVACWSLKLWLIRRRCESGREIARNRTSRAGNDAR